MDDGEEITPEPTDDVDGEAESSLDQAADSDEAADPAEVADSGADDPLPDGAGVPVAGAAGAVAGAGGEVAGAGDDVAGTGHEVAGAEVPVAGAGGEVAGAEVPVAGAGGPVEGAGGDVDGADVPIAGMEATPSLDPEPAAGPRPDPVPEPEAVESEAVESEAVESDSVPVGAPMPAEESVESVTADGRDPEPAADGPTSEPVADTADAAGSERVGEAAPAPATDSVVEPAPVPEGAAGEAPAPKAPKQPSRILEGVVTAVSAEEAELRLDDGRTAVINRRNFGPGKETPDQVLSIGDRAFGAELKRDDPRQRVVLSRAWALKKQAWDKVAAMAERNDTLTGTVTSAGAKGLVVDVGVRGFIPSSHLELEPVADLGSYVGQKLELRILEADPRRERLVLSRRAILLREQRRRTQDLLASLTPGTVCTGTVTSLTNYGAFVDIGGVNGLVHVSELAWTRVRKPSEVVSVGQQVEVKVLDVKAKKRRISLSIRQLTPDPLTELEVGTRQPGRVTRLVDFGAFVAVGQVEGLVHLSEMAEYRVASPAEIVTPGDEVWVKILSVDTRRRRVELSIRRAAEYG